ncbi:MAG: hypothetical protein Q9214_005739, partial [Letrouitia sp. 1 TL-2023]
MAGLDVDMLPMSIDLPRPEPQAFHHGDRQLEAQQQPQVSDADDGSAVPSVMTGAGAGPLPTGFGTQTNISGGSTLTDFTKRRNWSQRVLEELKDFLHILTPDGRILYVSPSGKHLTGYDPEELNGKFIMDFIHPDD